MRWRVSAPITATFAAATVSKALEPLAVGKRKSLMQRAVSGISHFVHDTLHLGHYHADDDPNLEHYIDFGPR